MDRTCAFISRVENVWGSSKLYIFKMERKTICRMYKTVGVVNTLLFSGVSSVYINKLSNEYNNYQHILFGDYPSITKLAVGSYFSIMSLGVPLGLLGVSDGIYDIIKGTHHGLGLLIWDKLKTKNSKNIEERLE